MDGVSLFGSLVLGLMEGLNGTSDGSS